MNSKFEILFYVVIFISILYGITSIIEIKKRLKTLLIGKNAKNLEDTINFLEQEIKKLKEENMEQNQSIKEINQKLKKNIRGIETLRFNPFPDQGSNQSFAIGLLNEEDDGVVISSLYSRDRMSIFAKPIKSGKSEYELTNEEKKVIEKTKNKV